jgi:hypothetical protein
MNTRLDRTLAWLGIPAVALWIAGLYVSEGMSSSLADNASDGRVLAWYQDNTNEILAGGWLFILGCLCLVGFAAALRARMAAAEDAPHTLATIAFAGAVMTAVFAVATHVGDLAGAIAKDDMSPATAGALHHLNDAFFIGAELTTIVLVASVAALIFQAGVLPRLWGAYSVLLAVVLVIGPIGWAALIFGTPVWTLGTSLLVGRTGARRRVAVQAPAR